MTQAHRSGRRALLAIAAVLALLVALSACGLDESREPDVIAAEDLPSDLVSPSTSSTSSTIASPRSASVTIYYLVQRDGVTRLQPVVREVANSVRARDRLAALLSAPTAAEQAQGIVTSIPGDTVLLDTELVDADRELLVDLSRSLFDVQGPELRNAFAQIVWTATEVEGIQRVRFLVEGEEFRAPDEAGVEQPGAVTRADYASLNPATPVTTTVVSPPVDPTADPTATTVPA